MQISVPAVSLRRLAAWGLVVLLVGFWHGRYLSQLESTSIEATTPVTTSPAAPANPAAANPVAAAPSTAATPAPRAAEPVRVTIRLVKFAPNKIQIHPGDEIVWENKDLTPHTVTSAPGGAHELDSGPINAGATWSHRFTTAGTFAYYCTFHPEMKGIVEVR